jgi:hypothetical protein
MTLRTARTPIAALLAVLALAAGALAPGSAAADPYLVRDVRVDATAGNAIAAREEAVADAQRIALRRLAERLTGSEAAAQGLDAASLVQGIEVQEERTSAVRYVGTLAIRFSPQAVRRAFERAGVGFAAQESPPALVLPLTVRDGQPVLWEVQTPWRSAWDRMPSSGLVPVLVPFGDLADVTDASTDQVAALDPAALSAIGQRYGAGSVVVARAVPAGDGPGRSVRLFRVPVGSIDPPEERTVSLPAGADGWDAAVRAVMDDLDRQWRERTVVASGPEERLVVRVPISGMEQWMEIRRRLAQTPQVVGADLELLSRTEAVIEVRYRGGAEALREALSQRRLLLDRAGGGPARLVLTGG